MTDTYPCYKIYVMRQNILRLIFLTALFVCGAKGVSSQERPKLREIGDKKYEAALNGVAPYEKKGKCGYANSQGKFFIPAIFHKVRPMSDRHVGFVCFLDEAGEEYWTPISLKGLYLTDLNFSRVVKDFDDRGLAVVRQEDKYGIINHTGKMVAGCNYQHFEDKTPVYILYRNGGGCIAVAKDKSDKGYTSYSFAAQEPIIVKAEEGYGIISPKNYFVVAGFVYDSVKEFVTWEAYCLQKGQKKYLYAADKLSMGYEDIIPEQGGAYYVVKNNGKYGILTSKNEVLLSCSQDAIPVLKKNEYTCFSENGTPVYLTVNKRVTASKYDDYLYDVKYKGDAAAYLLEETLAIEKKKYVRLSLAACYGTKNFDLLSHLEIAKEYAESRKFILLSRDNQNARFYDLELKSFVDYPEVLYHAFPSKSGAPAYASVLRSGKFGIMDVRNGSSLLEAEYDKITPIGKDYAILQKDNSYHLYNVNDNRMITSQPCEAIEDYLLDLGLVVVKQDGKEKLYNLTEQRWVLPDNHTLVCLSRLPSSDDRSRRYAALAHKGAKGALFDAVTGERLTDYLFDGVSQDLLAGKYLMVKSSGKSGLYDISEKRYAVPCIYDSIGDFHQFNGDDLTVVSKAHKIGLYNISKKKIVLSPDNDGIDIKGNYVSVYRGEKHGIYSLTKNRMIFNAPIKDVRLLGGDVAIVYEPPHEFGVCDISNGNWILNFDTSEYEMVCLDAFKYWDDGLLFVPGWGICDLVNSVWRVRLDWPEYAYRSGKYFIFCGGFESELRVIYDMEKGGDIVPVHSGSVTDVFVKNEAEGLKDDFAILGFLGAGAGNGAAEVNGGYKPEEWIPWDETEGGVGLYNIDKAVWPIKNSYIEYIGRGLFFSNGRIYDSSQDAWIFNHGTNLVFSEYSGFLFMKENGESEKIYVFEESKREILSLPSGSTPDDYLKMKNLHVDNRYTVKLLDGHWRLYDRKTKNLLPFDCDRISLMYEPK